MQVRCGRCGTPFEVGGPGQAACPNCRAVNVIRPAAPTGQMPPPAASDPAAAMAPPAAPPPRVPVASVGVQRVECPECGHGFAIGAVERTVCPMCSTALVVEAGTVLAAPAEES